ncbi:hypothetical protein LguiB_032146 [Lonicera macranthoides]
MEPKYASIQLQCILIFLTLLCFTAGDLAKDREQCASQLIGLTTCLPYVGGDAKAPTPDCCSGLKVVLQKSMFCLCILIKDRDDPNLGLKVNVTLALRLPSSCHTPVNLSQCPSLLHLEPNSPDAKVFEEFNNATKGNTTSPPASGKGNTSGNESSAQSATSDGGRAKKWLAVDRMACGLLIVLVFQLLTTVDLFTHASCCPSQLT